MKKLILMVTIMALVLSFAAGTAMAKDDEVTIVYVEWADAVASSNVVAQVIEQRLGYKVELLPVSGAAMWQALAVGDVDAMTTASLPVTHGHFIERFGDDVVNLGPNCEGAGIGLVVPTYVDIDSITELKEHADKFDNQIIGIDPGAGIMTLTEKAFDVYDLGNMELVEGSGATMTLTLKDKIENNEWVVVTGWTPHWKFSRWDLKYLEDPENLYGGPVTLNTVVRKGLDEDMPDVFEFLDNFKWDVSEISQVMAWNAEGADPEDSAKRWVEENPEIVNEWLGK